MMYYNLLFEGRIYASDIVPFFVVALILVIVSFFLIRDYIRAKSKKLFGPTSKLVAGIICGVAGLLHFPFLLFVLTF